jgi:hydroxypyruvate isomerase
MQRRKFVQQSILATGATLFAATNLFADHKSNNIHNHLSEKPFNLNYAIHDGMFKNNGGSDFIDQIKYAYDMGFRAIEDNGMMARTPEMQKKIGDVLSKLGMAMGVFVLNKGGNGANTLAAGKPEFIEIFLKGCREAIEVSKRINGKLTTVVPGDFERRLPIGIQTGNVIDALRKGADILEKENIIMVLEALSDTPDLFLRNSDQTYMICKGVNSSSCKILFDMYHLQKNEGNIITNIDRCWDEIAYFQIGDNPGRKEPTTGEMNYKNIFKHIYQKGYRGVLGMEHGNFKPGKEGEMALINAYRECDAFI